MLAQAELGRSLARTILRFTIPRKIDEGPALRALSVCASLGPSGSHLDGPGRSLPRGVTKAVRRLLRPVYPAQYQPRLTSDPEYTRKKELSKN
jgi:hypothetical protein